MMTDMIGLALDCENPDALADFYSSLLGWEKIISGGDWAGLRAPGTWVFAFQKVEGYTPPIWPWEPGKQQQMAHMDFYVPHLEQGVAHAIACGATKAPTQFYTTSTVLFDPAGHPFCLSTVRQ